MGSTERSELSPASPVMAGGNLPDWIFLLLLLSVGVQGQADDTSEGGGGSGDGGDSAGGDDEAWLYVEFLKTEVNEKLENILQVTFYGARDKKSVTVLEETVAQTLTQVMEIRESLLARIKDIRKEVIKIDKSQNVKQEEMLSDLRMEIMTILMLPQDQKIPQPKNNGDECDCGVLTNITTKVDQLLECADGDDDGSGDCPPPEMYAMDLITVNDQIDEDIKDLYNKLVSTVEDEERAKLFKDLSDKKTIREGIDELITKLMTQSDADKLKKLISRELSRINRQIQPLLTACQLECDGADCGCASEILEETLAKMEGYKIAFANIEDDEAKKEFVRSDMIKYIND